jgi:hypothetical protein
MAISLDESTSGVVVFCSECVVWTRPAESRSEGHQIAATHASNVHPGDLTARKSAEKYRVRHAARAPTIR